MDALGRQRRRGGFQPDWQQDSVTCTRLDAPDQPPIEHYRRNRKRGKAMKRTQSGMTLIGFVVVLAVVGLFAYIGMKLIPMYSEFYAVKQALKGLQAEPGIANRDPAKIQDLFFRRLYISYAENVKPEDVDIKRIDNGWQMDVNYEVRKPIISNLDVVGKFSATENLTDRGAD
jgi:hypothetical protein